MFLLFLEPFPNWLDDKILLDDVVPPTHIVPISPIKMEDVKPFTIPDTPSLLKEFETVLDAVEMTHGTLTPPQSPPYEQPLLTTLEPIAPYQRQMLGYPRSPLGLPLDFPVVNTPQPDVANELAAVDELVRTRVEDMVQWSGPSSPSSSNSSFADCSSDDPEWTPEVIEPTQDALLLPKNTKKRSKPYTRNPEDKKSRKKEQNKNAATRYRMKKKAEIEIILEEERKLQKTNEDLENKIGDLQRELKCLKGLMRDVFKAKGLIN